MHSPFTVKQLISQNFFQRLFGKIPKENAIIEINNLLATQFGETCAADIESLENTYRVNLHKKFLNELKQFYRDFLEHCFADKAISDGEVAELFHLKNLLGLHDQQVDEIHNQVAQLHYKQAVAEALADGRLEDSEKNFLEKLQKDLKLDAEIAKGIYTANARELLLKYLSSATSDERLSLEEEKELNAIAKNLSIEIVPSEETKTLLERYRLYWLIENGDLPKVEVDIILQRKEHCCFTCPVEWYEQRRITKRINYGGPTFRIRIAKGVYLRGGSVSIQRISEDVLTYIDSGYIYLTNKRLICKGDRKNATIALSKIIDFEPYNNGVEIHKPTGKSPFLKFDRGVDVFTMMLGRLVTENV